MDLVDLKQKPIEELQTVLQEQRVLLREQEFHAREGQLKQMHKIRLTKRTIARILTLLRAHEQTSQTETA